MNYFASDSYMSEYQSGAARPQCLPCEVRRARGSLRCGAGLWGGSQGLEVDLWVWGLLSALEAAAPHLCPSRMPLHSVDSKVWGPAFVAETL